MVIDAALSVHKSGDSLRKRGRLGLHVKRPVGVEGSRGDRQHKCVHRSVLERLRIDGVPLQRVEGVVGAHFVRVAEQRIRVVNVRHETGTQTCGQLHSEVTQGKLAVHLDAERQRGQRSVDAERVVRELVARVGSHIRCAVRGFPNRLHGRSKGWRT